MKRCVRYKVSGDTALWFDLHFSNDSGGHFMYLLANWMSSLEKGLIQILCTFLNCLLCCLPLSCVIGTTLIVRYYGRDRVYGEHVSTFPSHFNGSDVAIF